MEYKPWNYSKVKDFLPNCDFWEVLPNHPEKTSFWLPLPGGSLGARSFWFCRDMT
jgi:hypothetical protein